MLNPRFYSTKEVNRWSQLPPRSKEISCFHAGTKVRMYTTIPGAPQYKRMDKLAKGDKLWTRRYRRNRMEPSLSQISIVECVMTFACPPEGQPMVEIQGNFLTPDHFVARGIGEWATAGALAHPGTESSKTSAHIVYNTKLQNGGQIELGNESLQPPWELVSILQNRERIPYIMKRPRDTSSAWRDTPRDISTGLWGQPP